MADQLERVSAEDGACDAREDGIHCECWWDGGTCCSCGARGMTEQEMREQGMLDEAEGASCS
jgi:hypothetical protein